MPTLADLVIRADPERPALSAPGGAAISYAELRTLIAEAGRTLYAHGIRAGDRVAIVVPGGPMAAALFISVASAATAAPLNPAYTEDEFSFYLADLEAKAVIVAADVPSAARTAALASGIAVLEVSACDARETPGQFVLIGDGQQISAPNSHWPDAAAADDVALILHTSGTTAKPKRVPLRHRHLTASAANVAATLQLTPDDRTLNIMPLFHIHGLVASLLASISTGGHVVCAPAFDALRAFAWFADAAPTWYSAVPTMHQAILARAPRNTEITDAMTLRFIRSSSASLPPSVLEALETTFRAPVIEAYGMTEAAHQMTSNALPPADRKVGSVGHPAGPDVALFDRVSNRILRAEKAKPDHSGEVVIRGANVFSGYDTDPAANADAFHDGWFRTGDLGVFDDDGCLKIVGRLKEMINRGGEKIAPREVEDVLLRHPAVVEAVVFGCPHATLGEEVAAIVVCVDGQAPTARALKDFAAGSIARFKVPDRILFREAVPKGATGKVQRIGLAQKLGLTE